MKWCWRLAMIIAIGCTLTFAQNQGGSQAPPPHCDPDLQKDRNSFEPVGSLGSVDFGPYKKVLLERIRVNWIPFIPREARFPREKTGCVRIEFYISQDG